MLGGPFEAIGGNGFQAGLPHLASVADSNGFERRSNLMLYENDALIGFARSVHAPIREHGRGRFSHWNDWLVFSASDNTDPNTNSRIYSYCEAY